MSTYYKKRILISIHTTYSNKYDLIGQIQIAIFYKINKTTKKNIMKKRSKLKHEVKCKPSIFVTIVSYNGIKVRCEGLETYAPSRELSAGLLNCNSCNHPCAATPQCYGPMIDSADCYLLMGQLQIIIMVDFQYKQT